jgi:hypothetical protein
VLVEGGGFGVRGVQPVGDRRSGQLERCGQVADADLAVRRNHMLKGPQEVAPVFLETPHRIEALLLCHFLAMLTEALIERDIRTSMKAAGLTGIPLYPELRDCPSPSAPRILEIFNNVQRHHLVRSENVVQIFEPELTPLQLQVLELLHIPATVYTTASAT